MAVATAVATATMATAALVLLGCGKKGPPLAPLRVLPEPARQVAVRQTGDEVVISATFSPFRTDGSPLGAGAEVRVLRLVATSSLRPGKVSRRYLLKQFEREAVVVAALPAESIGKTAAGGRVHVRDAGAVEGERPGNLRDYLYAVLVVDAEGVRSPLPPAVLIEVLDPPPPPRGLTAATAEGEVRLSWSGREPERSNRETTPGADSPAETRTTTNTARPEIYNLYRTVVGDPVAPEMPLNSAPLSETSFVDPTFSYGETYSYTVRALAAAGTPLRESADSAAVEVRPVDVFPPAAPSGLAATAEGQVIRLYWFPNDEPDLGGYRIYRSEGPSGAPLFLGKAGPAETSFVDSSVVPGVRYHYSVSAIDDATPPNESVPSEEQSEMLPTGARSPDESRPLAAALPPEEKRR